MLEKPKNGWTLLTINGKEICSPSYVMNTPIDMLHAFIDCFDHGTGACSLDCEGEEYILVVTYRELIVISTTEYAEDKVERFDIDIKDSAKELLSDIINDFQGWISYCCYYDTNDPYYKIYLAELTTLCQTLQMKLYELEHEYDGDEEDE